MCVHIDFLLISSVRLRLYRKYTITYVLLRTHTCVETDQIWKKKHDDRKMSDQKVNSGKQIQ